MMLLHNARREARLDEAGDVVVLEEQDRGRWDRQLIAEALALAEYPRALRSTRTSATFSNRVSEPCRGGRNGGRSPTGTGNH
jgi:predicted RNA polymerase sigma factor